MGAGRKRLWWSRAGAAATVTAAAIGGAVVSGVAAVSGAAVASVATPVAVSRLAGADRFATSVVVSQTTHPDGADTVVLVGGRDQRDAVVGVALAGLHDHAPVLLVPPDGLRDDDRAELVRLHPRQILLVGGPDALSSTVESSVVPLASAVSRFSGGDGPSTAAAVATDCLGGTLPSSALGSVVIVDSGDAAAGEAAGALAASRGVPVLFAERGQLPSVTIDAIARLRPTTTYVIASPGVVDDSVISSLRGAVRISEGDVYATAVAAATRFASAFGLDTRQVVMASDWGDSVLAATLAGARNAPFLLVPAHAWHGRLADWFATLSPSTATIVGGEHVVDAMVAGSIADGGAGVERGLGATGSEVAAVQQRLAAVGFNPGSASGTFDQHTEYAVYALQQVAGLAVTGVVGNAELARLSADTRPPVLRPDVSAALGDHVEISIDRQLVQVVRGGQVQVSVHTSTGKSTTPTIRGLFRIYTRTPGFNSERMYNSLYFVRGFAIHGYDPVPLVPASHGCARILDADADLMWNIIPDGMPVIVW